ncbi:prolyl oligopeptidase family serine peptidase [Pseudoalteromonas umbrosa]|uniref:prolyl oligopeptidase family serine peptidase n=1 Tax=Pseudoalteromonas umbrosa TaxID=3048489 RepID=UPI0024C2757A|nr:prolyl oligopeptidase family serine peptidase [Pseudoalteromonas sp. B95]MDK1286393.1 prolyl oligopeptidase family serine peptidase [Pseudoalteromonas sp. B95]
MKKSLLSIAVAGLLLTGCQTTSQQSELEGVNNTKKAAVQNVQTPLDFGSENITLEQAMADPDWISRSPEDAYWGADSNTIYFDQKQVGNQLRDTFSINSKGTLPVSLSNLHKIGSDEAIYSSDGKFQAYTFQDNIFVKKVATQEVKQLTRTSAKEEIIQFMLSGELAFKVGHTIFSVDVTTGLTKELVKINKGNKPVGTQEPSTYIAKEQHKLIDYVALTHKNALDTETRQANIESENNSIANQQLYIGEGYELVESSISPKGDKLIVVVSKAHMVSQETKKDIMPNYIGQDGNIDPVQARSRVADNKPVEVEVRYFDLKTGEQKDIGFETLPGFDEDVLADVKRENAQEKGETYKSKKSPRSIKLMLDWYWTQSPIQWNTKGDQVALMFKAWDNKDRWIATLDFDKGELEPQHRLHDKAWVNYAYNDFGWLNNEDTLFFLSEETGYSHLYVKPIDGKAKQLTSGKFVVSEPKLTRDNSKFFFKANVDHPGIYEIYTVDVNTKEKSAITDLNGLTDYSLSPDESKVLLKHSKIMMPTELYVADAKPNAQPKRLTNTVSDEFLNKKLIAPKIVAVPSSHTDAPIYAKVYYPADYTPGETGKKRKAVIFNHGAGYLQNSHMGWSVYFREFMFHSLLASEGYVVMDMDYRASKGYGRDWRTAIYRQMGTPEIQDLADGVKWMSEHANVDAGSVGTYGGSYGGFMTFMALFTQPELFQAGAALRPVTDWAYYNDPYTSNILNRPDVDPIAYKRSSPIYFAEGLNKPLLINAPMIDDNVFFQDVVRLVQRFIELEKENFETAIYPVEPHGFVQPSSWLDEYRRIYKLFKENL